MAVTTQVSELVGKPLMLPCVNPVVDYFCVGADNYVAVGWVGSFFVTQVGARNQQCYHVRPHFFLNSFCIGVTSYADHFLASASFLGGRHANCHTL